MLGFGFLSLLIAVIVAVLAGVLSNRLASGPWPIPVAVIVSFIVVLVSVQAWLDTRSEADQLSGRSDNMSQFPTPTSQAATATTTTAPPETSPSASETELPPSPDEGTREEVVSPEPEATSAPSPTRIERVVVQLGDFGRAADNTFVTDSGFKLDFRFWWTSYTDLGVLRGRCLSVASIYDLPALNLVHRESVTSCSLSGWVQKYLPAGQYRVSVDVNGSGGLSGTGTADINIIES